MEEDGTVGHLVFSQSETGFLTYLDVSVGKIVTALNARAGRLSVMAQNPYNAVIHLGHSNGQFLVCLFFCFSNRVWYPSQTCGSRSCWPQLSTQQKLLVCADLLTGCSGTLLIPQYIVRCWEPNPGPCACSATQALESPSPLHLESRLCST